MSSHRIAALILLVAIALACAPDGSRPNIVLVTIDTLRADRLSAYGHTRDTTPVLDALAGDGVRFARAYSSSSWTAPSVVSLLTSLHPSTHGVEHGVLSDGSVKGQEVVPNEIRPLPELLKEAGYRTFGLTANGHLHPDFGFGRGFDRYRCLGFANSEVLERSLGAWQPEIVASSPRFVWIHLLDPHAPYEPQNPWIQRYAPGFRAVPRKLRSVVIPDTYRKRGVTRHGRDFALINALYDSEVAYVDAVIGRLLEALEVTSRDLVIVASDHGEEFLEHGRYGHGVTLFEEVIRVPLIVRLPHAAHGGTVVATPVSLVDLLPTVLEVASVDIPHDLDGRSLLRVINGGNAKPRAVLATLARFPALRANSLTLGRWKYVRRAADPDDPFLFDLETDPGEQRNLYAKNREQSDAMARSLDALLAQGAQRRFVPEIREVSAEQQKQLKALGYLK